MSKYVDLNVTVDMQDKLCQDTVNLLWGHAIDYWEDDGTFVVEFDDTIPPSLMRKLLKLIDTYPHDSMVMYENTVTFIDLGGRNISNIKFKVNVTRPNWEHRAAKFIKAMARRCDITEDYTLPAYIASVLTGGCVRECCKYWTPTVVSKIPERLACTV